MPIVNVNVAYVKHVISFLQIEQLHIFQEHFIRRQAKANGGDEFKQMDGFL